MPLLALLPELIEALLGFLAAGGWWQIPVAIGIWKVQDQLTAPPPATGQPPTPAQAVAGAIASSAGAAGSVATGVGSAASGLADLLKNNMPMVVIGLAAVFILGRR